MTDDIVKRAREAVDRCVRQGISKQPTIADILLEAADEIERLRKDIYILRTELRTVFLCLKKYEMDSEMAGAVEYQLEKLSDLK